MIDRRGILGAAAFAGIANALPAAPKKRPASDMLIVNALGGFSDLNQERVPGAIQPDDDVPIPARLLADAKASGMDAVNVTLGYVAGPMDPFEHSVREIATWNARLRHHADKLTLVTTAADILRARAVMWSPVVDGMSSR